MTGGRVVPHPIGTIFSKFTETNTYDLANYNVSFVGKPTSLAVARLVLQGLGTLVT